MNLRVIVPVIIVALSPSYSKGEYVSVSVENFEIGKDKWPETLFHGLHSSPLTTRVLNLAESEYGPLLQDGANREQVGDYGIEFSPLETDPHLTVTDQRPLLREKIGTTGAALIQVDFYFPEDTSTHSTMSILANGSKEVTGATYRFYRFGIDRDRVFFSFTNGKSSPDIYLRQPLSDLNLVQPGWHRLQIIFQGEEDIFCAIDGQITSFSPIKEKTLQTLEPGLMVTRSRGGGEVSVYADNLGIWSTNDKNDDPPLSPWSNPESPLVPFQGLHLSSWNLDNLEWLTSASEAWKQASKENKVIFAFFHDSNESMKDDIIQILNSEEATNIITQCVPLIVDAGSTSGKALALRYNQIQYPSIVLINMDGTLRKSVYFDTTIFKNWTELYTKLRETK